LLPQSITGGVKMQDNGDLKMQGFSWVPPAYATTYWDRRQDQGVSSGIQMVLHSIAFAVD
jgi:hypothetical protein